MTTNIAPAPILTTEQLKNALQSAREANKRIVSTNGVFDLLHTGHMDYLAKAKNEGDILVIAINSDASTKRIKGPSRPFWGENERATMLASLRWVDYVVIFNEDTPEKVLAEIKPHLHIKAGDYTPEQMPETAVVRQNGGDVKCISVKHAHSSSDLIAKIRNSTDNGSFKRPAFISSSK